MLAAATAPSRADSSLQLFVLALNLATRKLEAPKELEEHFSAILETARRLADQPRALNGPIPPEAVRLALLLKSEPEMVEAFGTATDLRGVTPQAAARMLEVIGGS